MRGLTGRWCIGLLLMVALPLVMADGGWEQFLADAQNSGWSSGLQGPSSTLCLQTNYTWSANTTQSASPMGSSPLVTTDNLLFYSTSDSSTSTLHKINLTSGESVWSSTSQFRFRTHLLRADDVIYVGLDNCEVIAIKDQTNPIVQHSTIMEDVCQSPLVGGLALSSSGDVILARNANGAIYGISTADLSQLWTTVAQPEIEMSSLGTLMIDPNRTDIAWMSANNVISWINTSTGAISQSSIEVNLDTITSSLVSAAGLTRGYFTTLRNQIYAFDLQNGTILWSYSSSRTQTNTIHSRPSPPAISADGQRVYAVMEYNFYALNATDGTFLYNISLASSFLRMPLWLNVDALDQVYFSMNGLLYSIDGPTGTILSQIPLPNFPEAWDVSVLVTNGGVIVQTPTAISLYTDNDCPTVDSESSRGDYVWIVTAIFCFFIVVYTILAVGEALRAFRNRKYSRIEDSTV